MEEKEAIREFLRERARAKDVVQAASVSSEGTTEAPASNKGSMAEGGVVGGSVTVGSTEPVPEVR